MERGWVATTRTFGVTNLRKQAAFAKTAPENRWKTIRVAEVGLKSLRRDEKPIHHSDRGCQYASHAYVKQAHKAGLRMSMTEKDHTAENAMAERVNGTLKQEYGLDANFENKREARKATGQGVGMYNNRRPHMALRLKTPQEVHGPDGED